LEALNPFLNFSKFKIDLFHFKKSVGNSLIVLRSQQQPDKTYLQLAALCKSSFTSSAVTVTLGMNQN